jgi:hypothetical protein
LNEDLDKCWEVRLTPQHRIAQWQHHTAPRSTLTCECYIRCALRFCPAFNEDNASSFERMFYHRFWPSPCRL